MRANGSGAVDAVLFDLGNVLVGWSPYGAFEGTHTPAEVDTVFADISFTERNHQADAGRSWRDVREDVGASHPQHVGFVDQYVERFASALTGPVPGTAEIVDELVAHGVPVFGLTNWAAELFRHAAPAAPAIGRLHGVVVSGEEGLAKPDPAIFELAARRFGLTASRTVFVDDLRANVDAAAALGFETALFTDAATLRRRLVDLAVLPTADEGWSPAS